jgi:septal ring factor EnvC (AmiA/AmiB activator)
MLTIESSLDWTKVDTELQRLGKMLPMFTHDIKKISKHLSEEVKKLSQLEVEHRNRHSGRTEQLCKDQCSKINQELKKIEQYHLMSLLAK